EIREKALGKDHLEVAETLNSLGGLYQSRGAIKEAEQYFRRSLDIREKAFGKYHPAVAESLDTLAGLYTATGRYREAEERYKTSLEIREKSYGKDQAFAADSQHNLGVLYRLSARYDSSSHYLRKAYDLRWAALGETHPKVGATAKELALLYAYQGKHKESHRFFVQSIKIEAVKRNNVFLLLSEREKLNYMKETEISTFEFLSHSAAYMASDELAVKETLDAWLQWKGAVMEAQGKHLAAVVSSGNEKVRELFQKLTKARREIAKLQTSRWSDATFKEIKESLASREKAKESLEAELSSLSGDFEIEKKAGKTDTAGISRILPTDSIYLDFAKIDIFDFTKKVWSEPRYLVFILSPGAPPRVALLDLGPAEKIDRHIGSYLKAMNAARSGYVPNKRTLDKEGGLLYSLVAAPLEPYIKEKRHLYISPDGNLNLVPFEVLANAEGIYPIEKYQISYIAAGRDIARLEGKHSPKKQAVAALILADPDYDLGVTLPNSTTKEGPRTQGAEGGAGTSAGGLSSFSRLPDTKGEADTIQKILTEKMNIPVRNYQDRHAIEAVLLAAESPAIVHLATHGYFIGKDEGKDTANGASPRESPLKDSPMFRSGLALAGINLSLKEGKDEGIMSAEKVMGLRLLGTELVVLSACETGVGDVEKGEGVFGLKRAFILSGAKAVVLSLWSVPSAETMQLMTRFYGLMAEGKPKAEALRQSKLELMRKKANPFYWGAFILVGNPY
ncbi:MAG TPA: CHAT domain-containing tetratricopeptide repeat protein, partial [Syntrophorhabdaceae bacterium]